VHACDCQSDNNQTTIIATSSFTVNQTRTLSARPLSRLTPCAGPRFRGPARMPSACPICGSMATPSGFREAMPIPSSKSFDPVASTHAARLGSVVWMQGFSITPGPASTRRRAVSPASPSSCPSALAGLIYLFLGDVWRSLSPAWRGQRPELAGPMRSSGKFAGSFQQLRGDGRGPQLVSGRRQPRRWSCPAA
jgi:hypothetical protein